MESFEDWNRRIEITFNKLENTESVFDVAKEEIISLGFEFYAFGVKYSTPFAVPRVEMYSNYPSDCSVSISRIVMSLLTQPSSTV